MWFINGFFNLAMQAAWKPVRSTYDGLKGSTKVVNQAGETVRYNPAQTLARRLKQDIQTIGTGNRYNFKTGKAIDDAIYDADGNITGYKQSFLGKHIGNRAKGIAHLVGDLTLGTAGTMLGWGTRIAGGATLGVTKAVAPLAFRGLGHVTYQTGALAGELAIGGARMIHAATKTGHGRALLFGGGAVGATILPHANKAFQEDSIGKLAFYQGSPIDSLPGTLAAQGASSPSPVVLDNLGADGDLVFALHNLR